MFAHHPPNPPFLSSDTREDCADERAGWMRRQSGRRPPRAPRLHAIRLARENTHARLGSLSLLRRRRANIEEEDEGLDFTRNTFFFLSRGWGSGRRPFSLLYPHPRTHGAGWVGGAVQCSSFFSFCGVLITVFELFFLLLLLLFFWHFTGRIVHTARDVKGKREERVDRTGRTDGLQVCCSSHTRCLGGKGKGKKHRCFWYHHLLHLLKQERKRKQKNDSFSQPLSLIHSFTNASALFVFFKIVVPRNLHT